MLYIKYIEIYRKLEECYDQIVHPQKRIFIKKVLIDADRLCCKLDEMVKRRGTFDCRVWISPPAAVTVEDDWPLQPLQKYQQILSFVEEQGLIDLSNNL